jgi:hypothetical protein
MNTPSTETATYCGHCGREIPDAGAPRRFGEPFCSDAHAEEFVARVRADRVETARGDRPGRSSASIACALPSAEQRTWKDYAKRGACWGAPLLLLIAIPLFWSGGWAATGGSLLSVVAVLACPISMYFMMRGMMGMQPRDPKGERAPEDRRA